MVKVKDVIAQMERIAPPVYAEDWDNIGLMVGGYDRGVKNILVCLDVTDNCIKYAAQNNVQMIISHHPVIFSPLRSVTNTTYTEEIIIKLIERGISVYSAHTNLDNAPMGVNDRFARQVGLNNISNCGIGRIGMLQDAVDFEVYCQYVCKALNIKGVMANSAGRKTVRKIALCCGSGSDAVASAIEEGADAFVTGEIKHNVVIEAVSAGMAVIETGHYHSEKTAVEYIYDYLSAWAQGLQDNVKVIQLYDEESTMGYYAR